MKRLSDENFRMEPSDNPGQYDDQLVLLADENITVQFCGRAFMVNKWVEAEGCMYHRGPFNTIGAAKAKALEWKAETGQ